MLAAGLPDRQKRSSWRFNPICVIGKLDAIGILKKSYPGKEVRLDF